MTRAFLTLPSLRYTSTDMLTVTVKLTVPVPLPLTVNLIQTALCLHPVRPERHPRAPPLLYSHPAACGQGWPNSCAESSAKCPPPCVSHLQLSPVY